MSPKIIIIGQCKYSPATRKLYKADGKVKILARIVADLLELFISKPNYYFSLQELESRIWPDKAIEQASVARWISTLRKELGETSELIYIENKRSEGYRLVATIKEPSIFKLKYFQVILTIGLVLSPVYVSYLKYTAPNLTETPKTLTTLIGQELDGAYHNGLLVFSHKPKGSHYWNLYAKDKGSDRSFALTNNNFQNRRAVFSPDGQKIAFQQKGQGKCEIIVADINREAMSLENETFVYDCKFDVVSVSITWKDDNMLILAMREQLQGVFGIYTLDLNSSELVNIITPPAGGQGDYYVSYSQKVNKLVYFRNIGFAKTEIWMYDPLFSKSDLIASVPDVLFTVAWVKGDKELVFRTGKGKVGKLDYITKSPIQNILSVNYPIYWLFSIDNDSYGYVHGNLRVRDIVKAKIGGEVESIASSSHDYLPVYAEAVETLAFVSKRSGNPQVWLLEPNGELNQLTNLLDDAQISHLAISDDGSKVVFATDAKIHIINNTGDYLFSSDGDVIYKNPVFSKDGNAIYYAINYDGTWRIESRNLNNLSSPVTLTEGHIIRACEGHDCLYFLHHQGTQLYKLENSVITDTGINLGEIQSTNQFHVSGDVIYYVEKKDGELLLNKYIMSTKIKHQLTTVPSRHFSFDAHNNLFYTIITREGEIFLEQARVPQKP